MELNKTTYDELPVVMEIISDARRNIGLLGIDQWQDGYPTREIIKSDIDTGIAYVYRDVSDILGTIAILFGGEPTYTEIFGGKWLTDGENYVTIHRIAVKSNGRRHGIASEMIECVRRLGVERGVRSIRVDTHEGNIPMRSMLEKNGFTYCGIIHLDNENHSERVAYERLI